ncbi:ammonium transporter Rh type C-like 2 [Halyomorpha halys]|uniref:ammonium transporter Rh type C-like 2 n=1 Tax=Halyomorpha halys TaxID=286706 RepID=UPI0006D4F148|nr:ammonium transporter Rh type C-like 2 [Halyomorpha halys]
MALDRRVGILLIAIEIIMIPLFGFQLYYGRDANPVALKLKSDHPSYYPMFQDVHVMLLVGFGFLMTFLRRYGYSAVSFNFLLSAIVMQWGLLIQSFFKGQGISIISLIETDISVAAVLISFGCILGKTTPAQLVLMALLEVPIYLLNEYIGDKMSVPDPGGSIYVHVFGAYFGLSVSRILGKPKCSNLEATSYNSELFAMIGTLFLWVFWPSFNGVLCNADDEQQRAIINTYIALTASCVTTFAISTLTDSNRKLTMGHIQNATLAGGVAVGTVTTLMIHPFGAIIIGIGGGVISTLGFVYVQKWLERRTGLHDSCGVHNLHGLPGMFGGITSAIVAAIASQEVYGPRLFLIYKARAPEAFSPELKELQHSLIQVLPGENRSALGQAVYQLLGLAVTLVVAVTSGIFTGLILKVTSRWTGTVPEEYIHNDELYWNLEQEEDKKTRPLELETGSNNTLNVV